MKEKCLIDTSILLKVILEGEIDVLGNSQNTAYIYPLTFLRRRVSRLLSAAF